jgi:hypothetical protein
MEIDPSLRDDSAEPIEGCEIPPAPTRKKQIKLLRKASNSNSRRPKNQNEMKPFVMYMPCNNPKFKKTNTLIVHEKKTKNYASKNSSFIKVDDLNISQQNINLPPIR